MNLTIEKARPEDAADILDFLKQIGGETDNLTFGAEGMPFTVKAEAEYIKGLENSCDSVMLIAKDNGKIIANASLIRLPRRMCHRGDFSVAVLRDYWNRGVGSKLMSEILDFARKNSFEIIELQVRSDNLSAIRLYEKHGFQKIYTYPSFFKIGNEYFDADYMFLKL